MEHSRNIPMFNVLGKLFWEYFPDFHMELSPNTPGIYHGNVPRIFHEHLSAQWVRLSQILVIYMIPYIKPRDII